MGTIVILVLLGCAVAFLFYLRARSDQQQTSEALRRAAALAKYVVAVFLATYGSGAVAAMLVLPLLVYGRVAHSSAAADVFSSCVDRPYFPLQTVVAFAVGLLFAKRLREGKPALVWVLPVVLFVAGVFIVSEQRGAFETFEIFVWGRFFDWGCNCSATLLQWQVMMPLYTSIAFSIAAFLCERMTFTREDRTEGRRIPVSD